MKNLIESLGKIQGELCISIVVPAYRISPDSQQNRILLENAIKKADQILQEKSGEDEYLSLMKKLKKTIDKIDLMHTLDGIGVYVSESVSEVAHFPFEVNEKVIIDNKFYTREVAYAMTSVEEFWLLSLSKKTTRLFKVNEKELKEIQDERFPFSFEDQYQHEKQSSPYDLDKSNVTQKRFRQFFRKVDEQLNNYLEENGAKLLLMGVSEDIGLFNEVTKNQRAITGKISGNYEKLNHTEIHAMAREKMKSIREQEKQQLLFELEEALGRERCTFGINDVLQAIQEGRGETLVIEKDFNKEIYLSSELLNTSLDGGMEQQMKKVDDAVGMALNLIMQKNGNVVFVENGELKKFDRIALMTRY